MNERASHQVTIIVGAQWGDEGKGKWVDILAEQADIVVRYQGGNNAGHTIYVDGVKTVLHQIPSGILRAEQKCALTAGVVINPVALAKEIAEIKPRVKVTPDRLWLSARAHVINPWTLHLDQMSENSTQNPIGTTKRGIGPTYAEKAARIGIRLGDYVNAAARENWIQNRSRESEHFAKHLKGNAAAWSEFHQAAEGLAPFVQDAEHFLRRSISSGKNILLEGAQGSMLDLDHGTYPFVTSSSTGAGGALASLGFAAKSVTKVFGVAKAYVTRVGSGSMPTELDDEAGQHMAKVGQEFGATTGRARRCGWLDMVALRYAIAMNGFDSLIINKLDILTGLPKIKIATAYDHPRLGRIDHFPWDHEVIKECRPVYENFEGWNDPLPLSGKISDLPRAARNYISAIERLAELPVGMVGTGVHRENALF